MITEIKETDFFIKQGATFASTVTWKDSSGTPVDMTGYSARMYFKRNSHGEKLFELTTSNGRITLNTAIDLYIAASDTANLTGKYEYDLELVQGSFVKRLLQGTITIDNEITR